MTDLIYLASPYSDDDGWKTSKGVRAEIGMAVARKMPVEYMEEGI